MDSSAGTSAEHDQGKNKKPKHNNSPQKEHNDVDPVPISAARQLREDELSLIFRNPVISTQDLLNFRLVNKVWWEAATACLRQSDSSLICITLHRHGQIPSGPQEGNNDDPDPETSNDAVELFSCRHKYKDSALTQLSELINVISNSPKFPSTNIHLHWSGSNVPNYSNYPDLLLFFELHGSKIKTLCPQGFVSNRLLSEILTIYLPKLERLDLSKAKVKYFDENDANYLKAIATNLGSLPLKSLILNDSFCENLSPLLLSPPFKLSSVLNVNFYFLPILLKKDKANIRLVAGINFHPGHLNFEEALPLMQTEFSREYPKLIKLTLVLDEVMPAQVLSSLVEMNKLLSSSKDSLEHLKICVYSDLYSYRSKLEIPPIMKNLKCLTFSGFHQACRVDIGERGDRISVFSLHDKIPPEKYFPSLVKVRLKKMDLRIPNNFVWLFKFKSEYQGCFLNVETLEVEDVFWPKIPDAKLFSSCFPNVRVLKTVWKWKWTASLESSLWVICPLVEFMEIYDDDDSFCNDHSVEENWGLSIDVFFTGFTRDLCLKLRRETLPQNMNNPVTLNFVRITPSICDVQNLKELKLKFSKRPLTRIASKVTQAYAFAQMPNTRFILEDVSYPPQSSAADSNSAAASANTGLKPEISQIITMHITLPTDEIEHVDENNIPAPSVFDLCKDKLSTILSLLPISTNDLLTFRLVSKLWRDVATEILLQRESCYVTLYIKKIRVSEIEHYNNRYGFGNNFCVDKYRQKETELSVLTKLMTSSPKFPAYHVHLHSQDSGGAPNYGDYLDLLEFFQLHGSKIKTLRHYGNLSTKDLWDTLFIYAPRLECLDLSRAKIQFSPKKNDSSTFPAEVESRTTGRIYPLTSLAFPYEVVEDDKAFGKLIYTLLSLPSNLCSIENVNLRTLAHILKKGKGHLIKSFEYIMDGGTFKMHYSLMKQLSTASPKLSTLTLDLKEPKLYNAIVASVNAMLQSSKDTLQVLKVSIAPLEYGQKLKIPPMKNLKSIALIPLVSIQTFAWKIKHPFEGERTSAFLLEDGVCGPKYFPNLFNVVLKDQDFREVEENLLSFFDFQSHQDDDSNRNYFSTVAALEILNCSCWPTLSGARRISVIFPNVRVMKINWHSFDVENLKGNLWILSPLVEFMEIYDVANPDYQEDPTTCIDVFFTGFSRKIITKLRAAPEIPQCMNNPETWDFLRTAPSICHLRHLKEFKLKFLKGSLTQFASRVTGDFAFAQMPSTKFIISYDPERFFEDHIEGEYDRELLICFSSIKSYAQVVCEERIDYRHMQ